MNCAFEFHDSRLVEFERREDGSGYLLFRGVLHRAQGELFQAGQESGFQLVRMSFTSMHASGPIVLDEYCLKGSITLDGRSDDILHLPMDFEGSVRLTLDLSPDFETTVVDGQSIRAEIEGEFERERIWEEDDIQVDRE